MKVIKLLSENREKENAANKWHGVEKDFLMEEHHGSDS